jgi:dTDP-4-amino-4,6-dideoxygalactose transaminase
MNAPLITVPQADPGASYRAHQAAIDAAVARALGSGWYILGQEGAAFEREFATWLGTPHAVGVANGTDALALILRGLGIGPGDAVATVSHTAVATVAAIEMVGATPLLLDIDPASYTLDPAELGDVLAHPPAGLPPIRAVIAVHLYGQPADLDAIVALCAPRSVHVIEDCSQCHGARLDGRLTGTMTVAGAFSLYPTKNLGALGDGGVISTGDAALAERLGALRQYGWKSRYVSDLAGVNSRLDELQAAILRVKLVHLDAENARRQAIAAAYDAALAGTAFAPPTRREGANHVFHQYVIRPPDRDAVGARLRAQGVATNVHYPVPIHRQPAYRGRVALGPAACRATEAAAAEVLSLPMFRS